MQHTNCVLLYTDTIRCRGQFTGTERQCRAFLARWAGRLDDWALYKAYHQGRPFHNATDERYLIDHDDPFWRNVRGEG